MTNTDSTDNERGPERIFAFMPDIFDNMSVWQDEPSPKGDTVEYIRADLAPDPLADARVKALVEALRDMRRQFSPYPSEDTERWREEHEACEAADAALAAFDTGGKDAD